MDLQSQDIRPVLDELGAETCVSIKDEVLHARHDELELDPNEHRICTPTRRNLHWYFYGLYSSMGMALP